MIKKNTLFFLSIIFFVKSFSCDLSLNNDTSICFGESLQLLAEVVGDTGTVNFTWSASIGANPLNTQEMN